MEANLLSPFTLLIIRKQLEAHLVELGSLLERAERRRVQDLLKEEQSKVKKDLKKQREERGRAVHTLQSPSHSQDHQLRSFVLNSIVTSVFYTAWKS